MFVRSSDRRSWPALRLVFAFALLSRRPKSADERSRRSSKCCCRHRSSTTATSAVAVKHLKTGESYEYKADRPMPTASLIKLPVMIATYEAVDEGKLSLDDDDRTQERRPGARLRHAVRRIFRPARRFRSATPFV